MRDIKKIYAAPKSLHLTKKQKDIICASPDDNQGEWDADTTPSGDDNQGEWDAASVKNIQNL